MSVSKEHYELLAVVGALVDREWEAHGQLIAGEKGFKAIHTRGVQWAHPPLPIFMYALAMMPVLSNGAKVNLWGSPDPLALVVLNINHSQTRTGHCGSRCMGGVAADPVFIVSARCAHVLVRHGGRAGPVHA